MSLKETTPNHYGIDGIDPISVLPALYELNHLTNPMVIFYYGNVIKYIWRFNAKKTPIEDIDKAIDYLQRIKDEYNKQTIKQPINETTKTEIYTTPQTFSEGISMISIDK